MTEKSDPLLDLKEHMPDAPIAPATGIAAIALNMSLKYHDIGTVQDGALYQQYKIEGRNMVPLHLDMVFETAIRIEAHLLSASERIAKLVVDAIEFGIDEDEADPPGAELNISNEPESDGVSLKTDTSLSLTQGSGE